MTVAVQTPISSYTGNGVTTAFSFGYYVAAAGDLVVMVDGVVKTITTDYTLTGIGSGSGGTCTFVTAPASGADVVLYRDTDLLRDTDYQDNGDLLAAIVNADFDRLWLALQETINGAKMSSRAIRAPVGETLNELGDAAARAGKVLSFNASTGQPEAVAPTSGTATDLAIQLASTAAGDGADIVGFRPTQTAAADTVAGALMQGAVNLEWWAYLATGNDYTAPLAAAMLTGKNVYVPRRATTRTVTAAATFAADGQIVFGDGEGSRIQMTTTLAITFNADGRTDCGVRGLWLEGPGAASAISNTYTQCGFRALTATRCFVEDCIFSGWAGGPVFFQDATDCWVVRNIFRDAQCMPLVTDAFGTADVTFWKSCVNCRVEGNTSTSGASYGVILQTITGTAQASYRNKIRGNTIVGSKNYGILIYNIDSAVHVIESTEISGNTIRDVYGFYNNPATGVRDYGAGIYVLQAEKTVVVGNIIENTCINTAGSTLTPAAIAINALSKATVANNEIKTSAWYGILVADTLQQGAGTNAGTVNFAPTGMVLVTGNNIQDTNRHAIWIKDKHNTQVVGNSVQNVITAGQSGIVLETTTANYPTMKRIKIDENTVFDADTTAIIVGASTGASVCNNTIDTASNTGIFAETTDGTICGNNIRNCTSRGIDLRSTGTNSTVTGNRIGGTTGTGILAGHRATFGDDNDLTGCTTKWSGSYAYFQSASPAAGTWTVDDRVRRTTATVGQPKAWVCTVAGTPGTWVSEGNL
jgi:hypothetical protein